jgi:hypothetical protein
VLELNCKIFRHGIYKETGKQLNPHATKEMCDYVIKENLVYGCARPFTIVAGKPIKCEYI